MKITGKEVFHGVHYYDGYEYQKDGPKTRCVVNSDGSKLVKTIHEALVKCEIRDGMTIGFHHHFRDGDLVVNMVMEEIHKMGIKNITICASSLGKAHAGLVPYMEDGTITGIQSSGVRGEIGKAISEGKLKGLAVMRSHGGRVRAIETGEVHLDIAFIGAPTCDDYGNCRGIGGKADCGVLSYAMVDADYADRVVNELFEKVFYEGLEKIQNKLETEKISTEVRLVQENITGYEGYLVVKADGCQVKKLMIALEETKIGRLYDIDVLEKENTKISRKDLGFPERKCLLCDNPACQCGRSRKHSIEELRKKIYGIIWEEQLQRGVAAEISQALMEEVYTTPKPA